MCKVCALAGLKSTINLSIKYLVTIFLKRETDNERSTGGNEFHKRGKRYGRLRTELERSVLTCVG